MLHPLFQKGKQISSATNKVPGLFVKKGSNAQSNAVDKNAGIIKEEVDNVFGFRITKINQFVISTHHKPYVCHQATQTLTLRVNPAGGWHA